MQHSTLDESWTFWLRENIDRGCDHSELVAILIDHGFSQADVEAAMAAGLEHQTQRASDEIPGGVIRRSPPEVDTRHKLSSLENVRKFPCSELDVYVVNEFLDENECNALVQLIVENLRSSTITIQSTDSEFRTSSTSDLSLLGNRMVAAIDDKIARFVGIPLEFSEGIQGQHYAPGEQFKVHTDFFEPGSDEYRTHGADRGNRTWTFMVYLNRVTAGGGTRFPFLDHVFRPEPGTALVWNNLERDGSPNRRTGHAGLPVSQGEKIIITKWFRQYAHHRG